MKLSILKKQLLILLTALLLTACQATPDTPAVVGKGPDALAKRQFGDFHKVEVPTHIKRTQKFPKLKISFDCDVIVPKTDKYPVTHVEKRVISEQQLYDYMEFCADQPIGTMYSEYTITKQEYIDIITETMKHRGTERYDEVVIENLHKLYDEADSSVTNPIFDYDNATDDDELLSSIYFENKAGDMSKVTFRKNGNIFIYSRDMNALHFEESYYQWNEETSQYWHKPGKPELTEEEAYGQAIKYIDEFGIDLDLYKSERCTMLRHSFDAHTGWMFTFTRKTSGLLTLYKYLTYSTTENFLPSFAAPWEAELLRICIDKEGLFHLWWAGASTITDENPQSVKLEDFDIIEQRIENQLNNLNGSPVNDVDYTTSIKITKIELGTCLLSVKDKPNEGEYIPTWYVSYDLEYSDDDSIQEQQIMFSAIDGSYVEPRITNKRIMSSME